MSSVVERTLSSRPYLPPAKQSPLPGWEAPSRLGQDLPIKVEVVSHRELEERDKLRKRALSGPDAIQRPLWPKEVLVTTLAKSNEIASDKGNSLRRERRLDARPSSIGGQDLEQVYLAQIKVEELVAKALAKPTNPLNLLIPISSDRENPLQSLISRYVSGELQALIIIGPTASGKTTTLEAIQRTANAVFSELKQEFPQLAEALFGSKEGFFVGGVLYDTEKRKLAQALNKPTEEFTKVESELLNRQMAKRLLNLVQVDPYVQDKRTWEYRGIAEWPAFEDAKRGVDRGLGAIPPVLDKLGSRVGIISLGASPEIPANAITARMHSLQMEPWVFQGALPDLGIAVQSAFGGKPNYHRLQQRISESGQPSAIQGILQDLFSRLKVELKGQWDKIRSIHLPREFKGLPRQTANDLKRLVYFMTHELSNSLGLTNEQEAQIIPLINRPSRMPIVRTA